MNYVSLELRKYLVQWISFIGLLLLRAFSSELFAGGAPPGPYCLLEFLREKFATQTVTPDGPCPRREQATSKATRANQGLQRGLEQEKTLGGKQEDEPSGHCPEQEKTLGGEQEDEPSGHCPESESRVEAAAEEYRKRVAAHEARRTIRRHSGPQWQCCECTLTFPAEGFGASAQNSKDVTTHCVAPGFWRCCEACLKDRQKPMAAEQAETLTQCQQCSQLRSSRHFEGFSDICNACTFRASFEIFICSVCNKAKHSKDMREKDIGGGDFLCSGCAPNLWLFECTACHEVKPATDFRDFRNGMPKLEKQTIRRCQRCEICMGCKRHFEDFSNFETNAQYCRTCYKRLVASKKCRVCGKAKTPSEFPYSQLYHEGDSYQNFFLRCTSCHVCATCKESKDIHAFDGVSTDCQKCVNNSCVTLRCSICHKLLPSRAFPDSQLHHMGDENRNKFLRCVSCHTCRVCEEQKNIHAFHEDSSACMQCRKSRTTKLCDGCNKKNLVQLTIQRC